MMKKSHTWEHYFGDDAEQKECTDKKKASWSPSLEPKASERERSKVLALYCLHRWDKSCLPFQNPCDLGVGHEWAPNNCENPNLDRKDVTNELSRALESNVTLSGPFVRMPPAIRYLRTLLLQGNPEVVKCFGLAGIEQHVYGIAAVMTYQHINKVGKGLAWHYDKSIGIETACISVPQSGLGHKVVGIGGRAPVEGSCGANAGNYRSMDVPVNSYWGGNAHAVFHAVGNKDEISATIVYRTLLPFKDYVIGSSEAYPAFMPDGARQIARELRNVRVRYFPDV
mmetsp:Transcript_30929/g.75425  ORF Transcript_30929/g.75425 Transcript_30929/m.75425 type:complete len:283 (-) Transcript_30929:73-921(-)